MIQLDMTCLTCYWGQVFDNEKIGMGLDLSTEPKYVMCKANPRWTMISEYNYGEINPDFHNDPEYHRCGQGKWWDKENARWIGLMDAEDSGPSIDE